MVSYAQNFEDVLLNRALAGVESGTYVDIGAGDPQTDSVTKAFYDMGWSGLNVEPLSRFYTRLVEQRPRDVNVRGVVSDTVGLLDFFEVEGYEELSTTVVEIAEGYRESGRAVTDHRVTSFTLTSLLEDHITGPIHFLKIDVEGAELNVLVGADFAKFRPWIVVVEAVAFGESSADEDAWVSLLIAADYCPVYFDGLNRYFLAAEKVELADAFTVPINVRDDFTRPRESRAELALERVAMTLGLTSFSDEHEVLERTEALRADRIKFELRLQESDKALDAARILDLEKESTISGLQIEVEAFEQQSFERERFVAALNGQIERMRLDAQEIEGRLIEANEKAAGGQVQVAQLLSSTSWRLSLPIRVLRRPAHYFRTRAGR